MLSTSNAKASSPLAPDKASEKSDVVFKKHVLKLGLDGSSLPRLVVVTDRNVYICLPSGGITRTVAVARVERVTLCPREDAVHGDREKGGTAAASAATSSKGSSGISNSSSGNSNATPPPSPSKANKGQSRSPSSFFASVFSRGGNGGKSFEKKSSRQSRELNEDVDETHPASPKTDAPPPSSLQRQRQQAFTTAAATSPSGWAAIVTLGVAFESPLALQLLTVDDGLDLVAALRASPLISAKAVFNVPDDEGPTNAAGELLFAAPPRREDPRVPRVLERDNKKAQNTREAHTVEEVQLSPSSPRSATAASPPSMPSPDNSSVNAAAPSLSNDAVDKTADDEVNKNNEQQPENASRRSHDAVVLLSQEEAPPHTPPSSSSPFSTPSSKASSVHIAGPEETDGAGEEAPRGSASESAVVLTPIHESPSSAPTETAAPQQKPPPPPPRKAEEPTSTHPTAFTNLSTEPDVRTPSPLRAAPLREAPPPPPLQPAPVPAPSSSFSFVAAPVGVAAVTAAEKAPAATTAVVPPTHMTPLSNFSASQSAGVSAQRVLSMDDEVGEAPRRPSSTKGKTTSTMWEATRDSELPSSSSPPPTYEQLLRATCAVSDESIHEKLQHAGKSWSSSAQNPFDPSTRPFLSYAHRAEDDIYAVPTTSRSLLPGALNTTHPTATAVKVSTPPAGAATSSPSPFASTSVARRTPVYMETLQAELAEQTETVARLRRSLQVQEALLLELAEVKEEVRALRTTVTERDAQCAEWQAAYTHAEEHVGGVRREQAHLLAAQEERLRRAHRDELEAVQAAFDAYDTRMTEFVEQLQRDHRDEAARWQHERRTLHHQIEELREQLAAEAQARAVAEDEAAAWAASPSSSTPAAYLDPSLGGTWGAPPQHTGGADDVYAHARKRAEEKLAAYVAQQQQQHQRRRQAATTTPPPPAPGTSPRSRMSSPVAGSHPTPASPWPQPRSAGTVPPATPPPASHVAFGAHRLFDNSNDNEGVVLHCDHHSHSAQPATASRQPRHRRDTRGDSLIQTPPSSSLKPSEIDNAKRDTSGYVPHRRTFV
jgi:hypothetical protein